MTSAQEIVQDVFARGKIDIPAWEDGTYTPNEDQFAAMAIEAVDIAMQQSTAPKLITGLALWNPGAEYAIEYRSLEFSGSLAEQFYFAASRAPERQYYANARQFIIAVPGDLNDEGIVKYLDARIESIKSGDDIWTTGLVLRQA